MGGFGFNMEFLGTHRHAVESRGRLFIPANYRKVIKDSGTLHLVVTKGSDGCLELYPKETWDKEIESIKKLSVRKKNNRMYRRFKLANAEAVEIDKQGRIQIPQYLLDYADLKGEVLIIGNLDFIEIWNPQKYSEYSETVDEFIDDILEDIDE